MRFLQRATTGTLGAMFLSPPHKRTFWRAVGAGLIAYCVSFAVLTLLFWLLTPFVWAAVYGEAYVSKPGPFSPDSGMWLVVQAIGFLVSLSAGAAAARWSPPGSFRALAVFSLLPFLLVAVGGVPDTSAIRVAVYVLEGPVGVILGAVFYLATYRRNAAAHENLIA
jgi:hypothetical protein